MNDTKKRKRPIDHDVNNSDNNNNNSKMRRKNNKEYIELIKNAKNIVCLIGAGISVSVGIPDFRSPNGIYSMVEELNLNLSDPQEVFDIEYFTYDPQPFYKIMYKMLVNTDMKEDKNPSKTHNFLAKLDQNNKILRCYTQNIDGLEEKAGVKQKSLRYCHGSFSSGAKCLNSKKCNFKIKNRETFIEQLILANNNNSSSSSSTMTKTNNPYDGVPMCLKCGEYPLKPGITFFGEKIQSNITKSLTLDQKKADLLLVLGTSLKVSPMKNIINYFSHIPQILINKQHVSIKNAVKQFDYELIGNADDIINHIEEELCNNNKNNNSDHDNNNNNNKKKKKKRNRVNELPSNIYCFNGCDVNELKQSFLNNKSKLFEDNTKTSFVVNISCDICNNDIRSELDGFSCTKCFGYDICKICYDEKMNLEKHKEEFGNDHEFGTLVSS